MTADTDGQSIPRELAALLANYDRTLDEFEAGRLTYDQAEATIQAQGAFDGSGRRWSVNEHRQFQVDDPAAGHTEISGPDAWVDPLLLLGAGPEQTPDVSAAHPVNQQALPPGNPQALPSGGAEYADRHVDRPGSVEQPTFWERRRLPLTIGGIVVAVVGGVFFLIGGGPSSEPTFTIPLDPLGPAAVTIPASPVVNDAATPLTDAEAEVTSLVGRFLSGAPDVVSASVVDLGTPFTHAAARTFWVGAATSGLVVEVAAGGQWTLSDGGVDVATASVSYVDVAGELKLVEWPVVTALSN